MKKRNIVITICLLVLLFAIGCGNKEEELRVGYVCEVNDDKALLFDISTHDAFYINVLEMETEIGYGDKVSLTLEEKESHNGYSYYKDAVVTDIVKKEETVWPATKDIPLSYTYRQAVNSNAIVMENEYIVSGSELDIAFHNAIREKKPYYLRVIDFGDSSYCCISDVFYNGETFLVVEDDTRNTYNEEQETSLSFNEYQYCETYDISGIELTYLTNTKDMMKNADEQGLFEDVYDENYSGEPLDMFWLYYDVSNYVANSYNQSSVEDENNTLTFEDGVVPCPNLTLSYQHYFTEEVIVSTKEENDSENEEQTDTQENESSVQEVETFEKTDKIVLKKNTLEVEPRDVLIERDGKTYKRTGAGTLELDLSGYAIVSNRTNTFTLDIDTAYDFNTCNVTVYDFKDLDNLEAKPLQEFTIEEHSTEIEMLDVGVYIYEVVLEDDEYSSRYVFVVDRED